MRWLDDVSIDLRKMGVNELLPSVFDLPFSRYVSPYFVRRFDLISHFLLHGTPFHLLQGLVNILLGSKVHVRMNLTTYYWRERARNREARRHIVEEAKVHPGL